jgi:hypothetical protein
MKRGYEVAEQAYAAFDAWLASLPDDHAAHDLSLLEQIDVYASQS